MRIEDSRHHSSCFVKLILAPRSDCRYRCLIAAVHLNRIAASPPHLRLSSRANPFLAGRLEFDAKGFAATIGWPPMLFHEESALMTVVHLR